MSFSACDTCLILILSLLRGCAAINMCDAGTTFVTSSGLVELPAGPWGATLDAGCQCNLTHSLTAPLATADYNYGVNVHLQSVMLVDPPVPLLDGDTSCTPALVFRNFNTSQIFHACPSQQMVEQNIWLRNDHIFSISLINVDTADSTLQLFVNIHVSGDSSISVTCVPAVPGSITALAYASAPAQLDEDDLIEIGEDRAAIVSLILIALIILLIFVVAYVKMKYDQRQLEERNHQKRLELSHKPVDGTVNAAYQSYGDIRPQNGGFTSAQGRPPYGDQQPITSPLYNDQNGLIGPSPLYADPVVTRLYSTTPPSAWMSPHQTGGAAYRGDPHVARRLAERPTARLQTAPPDDSVIPRQSNGHNQARGFYIEPTDDHSYQQQPYYGQLAKTESQNTLV